ncbi:MAG: ABC transporter ATP-binding protein [Desulfobacteraceae bacterium]
MTEPAAYHLEGVRHFYGATPVLDIDGLDIERGGITGLIGPNGSGKSTLLKLLAFAERPSSGKIFYNGRCAFPFSPRVRSRVTLLTQNPYLLKRTVFDNVAYGLQIKKETKELEQRVRTVLAEVGLEYDGFARRKWHQLSGGERQRVAMAARLILNPEVLLLDEPTASVDTKSATLIRQASLKARDLRGTTLVIASHDIQWLSSVCDKQLSIFKGTVFATGLENIIAPPFERLDNGMLVKRLGDGQVIKLKAPGEKGCTAVVRKQHIFLAGDNRPESNGDNQLAGHIASLLLEKKRMTILATVSVHDLSFVMRLTPDQVTSLALYPGKPIVLNFAADSVEWI